MVDVTYQNVRDTYGAPSAVVDADLIPVQQSAGTRVILASELFTYLNGKTYTSPVLKRYSETVAAATATVDRADGGIQTLALTADITLTATIADGESLLLIITGGDSWQITWPTMEWKGGSVPVLTAKDRVVLEYEGTTLTGTYVGSYS